MKKRPTDAVTVESGCASLLVSYKLTDDSGEFSDCVTFTCNFPGRIDCTRAQAVRDCVEQAATWAAYRRVEGFIVSAWDDCGNTY